MWRPNDKKRKSHNAVVRNRIKWIDAFELKRCLSFIIENNQNLISTLESNMEFFVKEKNRRLSAEQAYHKLQPRIRNLLNKIAMQYSIHSNMLYENTIYANLQNVLNELKISMKGKLPKVYERSSKASANEEKSIYNQKN